MIEPVAGDRTEPSFCGDQTSVSIVSDEKEKQNKGDGNQHSLLGFDSSGNSVLENDKESENGKAQMVVETKWISDSNRKWTLVPVLPVQNDIDDTELFDDFDPDNALIFKNPVVTKQVLQSRHTHSGKRKRRDSEDFDHQCSLGDVRHNSKRFNMDYDLGQSLHQLRTDDEAQFLESAIIQKYCSKMKRPKLDMSQVAAWRHGPAKYWFDLLGVPESGDGFDYGFELDREIEEDESCSLDDIEEDAFLMVSQMHWEDDIIWDIDDTTQEEMLNNYNSLDWIPAPRKDEPLLCKERPKIIESQNGKWFSNFPVENEELVYGLWENEIIWDAKAMKTILQPKILVLDPSDENILFGIPDDSDPTLSPNNVEIQSNTKIHCPHTKSIKSMLSKTGVIDDLDEEEMESTILKSLNLDPYNISNDVYYLPKFTDKWSNQDLSQQKHMPHSIPALQLQSPLVPTYMGPTRLRNFHRPPLKQYKTGRLSRAAPHSVLSLTKYISQKEKQRQESLHSGDVFFARSFEDLSGRDGNLVLVEFSEEHPPLMSFVGMCSKIKNYYKRKPGKDAGPPEHKYGETAFSQNGLFLGNLAPGQCLQALENNMYRAPIYEHEVSQTDFLVIRTRNQYYIREVDAVFVAGQECPLYEVPAPNSKKVGDFTRNFLQVFAYKAFARSKSQPPAIHRDVFKKVFPTVKPAAVKRQLSICANYNFNKADTNCYHWVLKPTFRLPLEDELRLLVSPEQCCAYFSMMAAQQRLKDAGYGDKSAFVLQDNDANDEEMQAKMDDEVTAAPWNTTRAYVEAMSGKCCLQLTGPADPTGCGEAFSYVRVPLKAVFKDEPELKPKKIMGTEADLRYLSAKGAETILRNYGVPVADIKQLTRWEMIDAVRTLSTIREDRGEEGFAKFSRSKRFSVAGCQQRYREECQRIFDLQNRVLSSNEVFSSEDEDENENEQDEDVERMAENIESLLIDKGKSGSMLEYEREEREREELLRMIADEDKPKEKPTELKKDETNLNPDALRILKIRRTFRNADGSEYTRVEIVRDRAVVDAYLRIRSCKDSAFIKKYAYADEELEREKKKIEAQLKSIKDREKRKEKRQEKVATEAEAVGGKKKNAPGKKDQLGGEDQELVKVDGTKLKFSTKLIKNAEDASPSTSTQNTPKKAKKRKRSSGDEQVDYSRHYQRPAGTSRQRADPVVLLSTIFEEVLTVMKGQKEFQPFLFPVDTKIVRDYRRIIGRPMDLQTIRTNLQQKKYQSRMDFLADVHQIKENSARYNGPSHALTDSAQRMLNLCVKLLAEKEDKIAKLENAINPPVDENDQEAFSEMINAVVRQIKLMPEAVLFLKPVNKNMIGSKAYYSIVKNPMDLETISKKIATHKYASRAEVMKDFQLIYSNCILFNGEKSTMKNKAEIILKTAEQHFDSLTHQILHLETSITSAQERAMRQADIDTSWMYQEVEEDDRLVVEPELSPKSSLNLSEDDDDESAMDTDCTQKTAKSRFVNESESSAKNSLNLSEDDSEDSNMGTNIEKNSQPTTLPTIYETSVLEKDLQCSSDDEL